MALNSAFNPDPQRQESLADRIFTFTALMVICFGLLVTYSAARLIWHEWPGPANPSERLHMIIRWHLLAGIVWLTAGGFLLGKRRIVGGLLLLLGMVVSLGAGGER